MSKYLVYLHTIGFTQKNLFSIFENNSSYQEFFENLSFENLAKLKLKDEKIFELMANYKKTDYSKIDATLEKNCVNIVNYNDNNYPLLLKNIPNPPFLLYTRGNINNNSELLSIVGSRKNTRYSQVVLEKFIPDLIKNNFGIVSGGAFGVDSLAHNITLNNSGYTLAVIGTGIDIDYPASNKALYEKIVAKGGAVVSIFRLGTGPENYNFPIRNEIIAGISSGTLVTEAGVGSGTLITARLALELNRDVFVIPGEINKETSEGANRLIRDGLGKLVMNTEDILNEYSITYRTGENITEINFSDETEKLIYELLKNNPQDASSIGDALALDIEIIGYKLTIMEIEGLIELSTSGTYNIK